MVYYNLSSYNSDMLLVGIFSWWYTDGLLSCVERVRFQIESLLDLFSIKLMFKTLFSPFRQISARSSGVSFDAKVSAFFDRTISRFVGAVTRLLMIIIGSILITIALFLGLFGIILWLLVPFMPVISLLGWVYL